MAEYILTTMNKELLAATALLVQSDASLISHIGVINFFAAVQCLANQNLQCTSRPCSYFNNTGGTRKGIYDLNSVFEKADRLLEQKRTGSQFHNIAPLSL